MDNQIISSYEQVIDTFKEGSVLAYLGKPIDIEASKNNE